MQTGILTNCQISHTTVYEESCPLWTCQKVVESNPIEKPLPSKTFKVDQTKQLPSSSPVLQKSSISLKPLAKLANSTKATKPIQLTKSIPTPKLQTLKNKPTSKPEVLKDKSSKPFAKPPKLVTSKPPLKTDQKDLRPTSKPKALNSQKVAGKI